MHPYESIRILLVVFKIVDENIKKNLKMLLLQFLLNKIDFITYPRIYCTEIRKPVGKSVRVFRALELKL